MELERSMLRKVLPLGGPDSARVAANEDLQARFTAGLSSVSFCMLALCQRRRD